MGRLTEFFDYINREKEPTENEILNWYSYITVDRELKRIRREYRGRTKKENQGDQQRLF